MFRQLIDLSPRIFENCQLTHPIWIFQKCYHDKDGAVVAQPKLREVFSDELLIFEDKFTYKKVKKVLFLVSGALV